MRAILTVLCGAAVLAGCASTPPYAPWSYAPPKLEKVEPLTPLDKDMNAEVGGVVYTHGVRQFISGDLVRFSTNGVAQLEVGHAIKVKPGDGYRLKVVSRGGARAVCLTTVRGSAVGIIPGWLPTQGCLIDENNDGAFETAAFEAYARKFPIATPIPYAVETYPPESSVNVGGVRREVVYSGTTNGTVRLTYREFSLEGMARPAFTEDFSYTLDSRGQAEVGLKGLRLKVISATNSRLTYSIERMMD